MENFKCPHCDEEIDDALIKNYFKEFDTQENEKRKKI